MFDYIEIIKYLSDENVSLEFLQYKATYSSGWKKYSLEYKNVLDVSINEHINTIVIKGSLPYFYLGHNFHFREADLQEAINLIENMLQIELYSAEVKRFEYGKILNVPYFVNLVFNSHVEVKKMRTRTFDHGKYFEDNIKVLKIYDAKRNLRNKQKKADRVSLQEFGYSEDKNFVKFEIQYKKPHVYFKNGEALIIADLFEPDFKHRIEEDFILQYMKIIKISNVEIPADKKFLSAGNIILLVLLEIVLNYNLDFKKLIKEKLKEIPEVTLSKEDKKARQRQIRKMFESVNSGNKECRYDLIKFLT